MSFDGRSSIEIPFNKTCPMSFDHTFEQKFDAARKRVSRKSNPSANSAQQNKLRTSDTGASHAVRERGCARTITETEPLILDPKAPLASARILIARRFTSNNIRTLHHHNGVFYQWTGTHYAEVREDALRALIYSLLGDARGPRSTDPFNPNRSKVSDLLHAFAAEANLSADNRPPLWLGGEASLHPEEIIACSNGLLHMPTLQLVPHTPLFFAHNVVDFAYDEAAPEPWEWLRFLNDLWPHDPEAIGTLQQIFGYLLTPDTRQQKAFLIVGPKRSGKGTIARVATKLLGPDNVVGPTLSGLSQQFGLAPLINRRLAIISDARLGSRTDQHVIAERVLSITGEDTLTIDRKYQVPWTGRLQSRFLILSNELPRLTDASGAISSRFIVLTLQNSFYGKEDHGLTDRLINEMPGILNWAVAGWRQLHERGHFIQPASSLESVHELEDLGSPIGAFVRDMCVTGPGHRVETEILFHEWGEWCRRNGHDRPGTTQTFGRNLRAAVPGLRLTQPRRDGDRFRAYEGIGLRGGSARD